jgi:hypothetical protein
MRVILILIGIAISGGALLFWLYLNGMAAAWNTSGSKHAIHWLTKEAFIFFWLPFVIGLIVALAGWRRS